MKAQVGVMCTKLEEVAANWQMFLYYTSLGVRAFCGTEEEKTQQLFL